MVCVPVNAKNLFFGTDILDTYFSPFFWVCLEGIFLKFRWSYSLLCDGVGSLGSHWHVTVGPS